MTTAAKRSKTPAVAISVAVLLAASAVVIVGSLRGDSSKVAGRHTIDTVAVATVNVTAPPPSPGTPTAVAGSDAETLRRAADYVSPDGRYVKIGSVEISTTGPISRPVGSP
jgi:hypothetical protein